jgi:tetratricopeptide (TPR) repeat protein
VVFNTSMTGYRRLHVEPDPRRYRAGYLAARAAKDDFAALSKIAAERTAAGKLEEAVPLFVEILNVYKAKLGPENPATIQTAETLGRIYWQTGHFKKAVPLLEDVLKKYRKAKQDRQTLNAMGMLGLAYKDADRQGVSGAEEMVGCGAASPGVRGHLGEIAECLVDDVRRTMGARGVLLGQKKYAEAEPLLVKGYEGMKQLEKSMDPRQKRRLREAVERLAQLHEAIDKKDEAAKWRKQLEAIQVADKKPQN